MLHGLLFACRNFPHWLPAMMLAFEWMLERRCKVWTGKCQENLRSADFLVILCFNIELYWSGLSYWFVFPCFTSAEPDYSWTIRKFLLLRGDLFVCIKPKYNIHIQTATQTRAIHSSVLPHLSVRWENLAPHNRRWNRSSPLVSEQPYWDRMWHLFSCLTSSYSRSGLWKRKSSR